MNPNLILFYKGDYLGFTFTGKFGNLSNIVFKPKILGRLQNLAKIKPESSYQYLFELYNFTNGFFFNFNRALVLVCGIKSCFEHD